MPVKPLTGPRLRMALHPPGVRHTRPTGEVVERSAPVRVLYGREGASVRAGTDIVDGETEAGVYDSEYIFDYRNFGASGLPTRDWILTDEAGIRNNIVSVAVEQRRRVIITTRAVT